MAIRISQRTTSKCPKEGECACARVRGVESGLAFVRQCEIELQSASGNPDFNVIYSCMQLALTNLLEVEGDALVRTHELKGCVLRC